MQVNQTRDTYADMYVDIQSGTSFKQLITDKV